MRDRYDILVVGVGGQGGATTAETLGTAAQMAGYEVTIGQLHGMSQRGGSIEASVHIGSRAAAFFGSRGADLVIGLEPLEVLRALPRITGTTRVLMNTGKIVPASLTWRGAPYPDRQKLLETVAASAWQTVAIDGTALINEIDTPRALNTLMLGAVAGLRALPFGTDVLWEAISSRFPARNREANQRAFRLGLEQTVKESRTDREPGDGGREACRTSS